MGAFNELILTSDDGAELALQFKFGERWQYRYRLHDKIKPSHDPRSSFGKFDVPASRLAADGSLAFYSITFEDGVITAVSSIDEQRFDQLSMEMEED